MVVDGRIEIADTHRENKYALPEHIHALDHFPWV
jgi:hypothetical protein